MELIELIEFRWRTARPVEEFALPRLPDGAGRRLVGFRSTSLGLFRRDAAHFRRDAATLQLAHRRLFERWRSLRRSHASFGLLRRQNSAAVESTRQVSSRAGFLTIKFKN